MADVRDEGTRSDRLHRAIHELLAQTPDLEAAAVVSFDGLPMASALPQGMDEDRVAAMSAALLSLGERATVGLGRGELSQVFIEGEHGTVFLVSADNEAVLVAVAVKGAKAGLMLYEVKRAAAVVADVLRTPAPAPAETLASVGALPEMPPMPLLDPADHAAPWSYGQPEQESPAPPATYAPLGSESNGSTTAWS